MAAKKMGRPTSDPKPYKVGARVNDEDYKTLKEYCEKHKKSQPEGIRDGIRELKNK